MSNINTQIDLSSVNFDDIRSSLIDWLKQRPEWADYDFTIPGSASALLIDILTAMTYKQNVQSNFAMGERFLSTARLRDNVLRRSKELNYTTHSAVSSSATLRLQFTPDEPVDFVLIPQGTRFQAIGEDNTYDFVTLSNYTALRENDYIIDIEIVEGDYLNYEWEVTQNQNSFIIPNPNIDTSRLRVNVKYSESDQYWTEYTRNYNIVTNNPDATVYYLEEVNNKMFKIYFGDGYVSKQILPGNLVSVDYLVTHGSETNNITSFELQDVLTYEPTITVISPATGGQDIEEIDSIKMYAPLGLYAQNRAVVSSDYEYMIKQRFPQITSISVWGGEENTPPQFGRVCISALTGGNYTLSNTLKEEISSIFDDNKIIGSKRLSWFDPEITQIIANLRVFYNPAFTVETTSTLRVLIQNAMLEYQKRINRFNSTFNFSDFILFIKNLDRSFTDVICTLSLIYSYVPTSYSDLQSIFIQMNTELNPGTFETTKYYNENNILVFLKDDGYGNINEYTISDTSDIITKSNIGTIDYINGIISISDITIHSLFQSDTLDLHVDPVNYNITTKFQNVFNISATKSQIEIVKRLVS